VKESRNSCVLCGLRCVLMCQEGSDGLQWWHIWPRRRQLSQSSVVPVGEQVPAAGGHGEGMAVAVQMWQSEAARQNGTHMGSVCRNLQNR
jgi:hypothetical protein